MMINTQSAHTALIIANAPGNLSEDERQLVLEASFVIVADGALEKIKGLCGKVHWVGDFDSYEESSENTFESFTKIEKGEQNSNDLEKCIEYALSQGATSLAIMGAIGGRLDHTLTTLSLMVKYHQRLEIVLYHELSRSFVFSSIAHGAREIEIPNTASNRILSIIPWGMDAEISLKNTKWCLTRETLSAGSQGVSNRFLDGPAIVSVHRGIVICTVHD